MRGVYFGDYHTVDDWGLILTEKEIQTPTPKIVTVNIDGRDGDLDLSRALTDDIKFNNREASFSFLVTEGSQSDRSYMIQTIVNAIHGQRLQIIEPDFPYLYLVGECSVTEVHNDKAYGSFTVEATCEPYRYYIDEVRRVFNVSDTITGMITNTGRKVLTPEIIIEGDVTIKFDNTTVSLSTGTYKLPSLILKPGVTALTLSGSGVATFVYREAII